MSENAAETMTAKATTEAALDVNKKLPVWKKIGYSFGEIGSQCSWTLISSYLTVFYTDVVGLTPVVISAIMLIARIWDAINDPMFGAIAENTKTRWGRFRPYILWGAPILALFNCLTFLNLDIPNSWKAIWCGFTYIGCGMAYTAVNISTQCVANVMTASNQERVSLNAYKGIGSGLIQMVISAVAMPMILHFGNGSASSSRGYFMAALVFSIVCVPCFWVCFASSKEIIGRKADAKKETIGGTMKNLAASFKYTFKNRDAVFLMLAMFTFLTGLFGRIGIMAYYCNRNVLWYACCKLLRTASSEPDEQKICGSYGMCRTGSVLCILLCDRSESSDQSGCDLRLPVWRNKCRIDHMLYLER